MQTHCQESLNPEAPKAGSANESKPLLRFGEMDNKERNQTRCRRLDKKHIINHWETIRSTRIYTLSEEIRNISTSNNPRTRTRNYQVSTWSPSIWSYGIRQHILSTQGRSMVARNTRRHQGIHQKLWYLSEKNQEETNLTSKFSNYSDRTLCIHWNRCYRTSISNKEWKIIYHFGSRFLHKVSQRNCSR